MTFGGGLTGLVKLLDKIGQVKWSLFLQDCEHGRVALSCHMAMDVFNVAELTSFSVFTVPVLLSGGIVTARKPLSHHGRAGDIKRRGMW